MDAIKAADLLKVGGYFDSFYYLERMVIKMQTDLNHKKNPTEDGEKRKILSPTRVICGSFLVIILIGTILLFLPISSKTGSFTPVLDAAFTATTATCVTGLVVVDTFTHWSLFGQAIILMLIQVGGIGLVTLTTFFIMIFRQKIGLSSMTLAQESVNTNSLSNLPSLVKIVVVST
ncbi:MAG: potassium transporter TrkG, partial [Oscillospiraceae bacterium]